MTLEILTPEKKLYSGEATSVTLPGVDGTFQLLNRHAPIISALGAGIVKYKVGNDTKTLTISGGFAECLKNKVIVLVEGAK
ncbi:MAG: ATP synthase F1 subunit epsilon [Bacteroidetes bacterium]|nr:ATP synthase F1 subunit epsilon [Bacteroidota bacterium]MBS1683838.1 ATP synthase F1 subunit epsilon [Bacteroidota bacterium]